MSEPMTQADAGRELVGIEAALDILEKRRAAMLAPLDGQLQVLRERREALRAVLPILMRQTASRSLDLADDDGVTLGSISLVKGAWKARVDDPEKFAAWVAERFPTEVVPSVRPAFASKLQADAKKAGDPVLPDTGELIPGLTVEQGDPYVSTKPTDAARARAAEEWNVPVEPEELVTA